METELQLVQLGECVKLPSASCATLRHGCDSSSNTSSGQQLCTGPARYTLLALTHHVCVLAQTPLQGPAAMLYAAAA